MAKSILKKEYVEIGDNFCKDCGVSIPIEFLSKKYGVSLCRDCWNRREING
jgi:RNA polymerase-binding transcription factor DksA